MGFNLAGLTHPYSRENKTPLADGVQQHMRLALLLLTEWRFNFIASTEK